MVGGRTRRSRAGERGAALFIVVMITTLITAVGVFAIHTSSMVERAAGYGRRASQAFYIGEWAFRRAGVSYFSQNQPGFNSCIKQKPSPRCSTTEAYAQFTGQPTPCCAQTHSGMVDQFNPTLPITGLSGNTAEGGLIGTLSRPGVGAPTQSQYRMELTEATEWLPAKGTDLSGAQRFKTRLVAITTFGSAQPAGGAVCSPESAQAASQQGQRAYVVYTAQD